MTAAIVVEFPRPRIRTECCRCGRVICDGPTAPDGGVSHGFHIHCANAWRAESGLQPMTPEEEAACLAAGGAA